MGGAAEHRLLCSFEDWGHRILSKAPVILINNKKGGPNLRELARRRNIIDYKIVITTIIIIKVFFYKFITSF